MREINDGKWGFEAPIALRPIVSVAQEGPVGLFTAVSSNIIFDGYYRRER